MKLIKVSDIPNVTYQFRHWGKWYWIMDDGEMVRIDNIIKQARVLNGGETIHN